MSEECACAFLGGIHYDRKYSCKKRYLTYYVVLNLKEGSKYKQKWVSTKLNTKGNKRKANEILNELIAEYKVEEPIIKKDDILFSDYLMQWLEKKKDKIGVTTSDG